MTRKESEKRALARKALGHRLKLLRVDLDMANKTVAAKLGIRPATLTAWEKGEAEIAALDALRLADLYRVPVAAIYGRKPDEIGEFDEDPEGTP